MINKQRLVKKISLIAALFLFCLATSACAPTVAVRGYRIDPDKIAAIETGVTSREDIIQSLGSPTQVSTFDEKIWYYIGQKTERYAFFQPEIIEQKGLEIHFDEEGLVSKIREFDQTDTKEIRTVARTTPTYGHQTTFFEQLVGNLGKTAGKAQHSN